jgi:hypothetical protein
MRLESLSLDDFDDELFDAIPINCNFEFKILFV